MQFFKILSAAGVSVAAISIKSAKSSSSAVEQRCMLVGFGDKHDGLVGTIVEETSAGYLVNVDFAQNEEMMWDHFPKEWMRKNSPFFTLDNNGIPVFQKEVESKNCEIVDTLSFVPEEIMKKFCDSAKCQTKHPKLLFFNLRKKLEDGTIQAEMELQAAERRAGKRAAIKAKQQAQKVTHVEPAPLSQEDSEAVDRLVTEFLAQAPQSLTAADIRRFFKDGVKEDENTSKLVIVTAGARAMQMLAEQNKAI